MNKIAMNTIVMNKLFPLLVSCLLASGAYALPEDSNEEITIIGGPAEMDLNLGLIIMRGTPDEPVIITQGSLKITGLEVTIVNNEDGDIHKVTVTGESATFQQQPEIDKEIVYASGHEIAFNNTEQLVTIDINAELIQGGNTMTGCHIDYQLTNQKVSASPCDDDGQLKFVIPPSPEE